MRTILLTLMAFVGLANAAAAQEAGDWDMTEDPARKLLVASTTFSSGLTVALRCLDGQYDALIAGLPQAEEDAETRTFSLQFGESEPSEQRWFVGTSRNTAISETPARLARKLRDGGQVQLRVREPGEDGRRMRYVLDLPTSNAAVDRTLSACGRPTIDPRDAQIDELRDDGLPEGIVWARRPQPSYPDGFTFARGFVSISCLTQPDGRLRDCVVESEFPLGGGFAQEALRATQRARVANAADPRAPVPTGLIVYQTRFRMLEVGEDSRLGRLRPRNPG